jgi:hypothetical protein
VPRLDGAACVIAGPAPTGVEARSADQQIAIRTTLQHVSALLSHEDVATISPDDGVATVTSIHVGDAEDGPIAISRTAVAAGVSDGVLGEVDLYAAAASSIGECEPVLPSAPADLTALTSGRKQRVATTTAGDEVCARATYQCVITAGTLDAASASTRENVIVTETGTYEITSAPRQDVVASAARNNHVVMVRSPDPLGSVGSDDRGLLAETSRLTGRCRKRGERCRHERDQCRRNEEFVTYEHRSTSPSASERS